jgi:hypothetical protein
MKTDIFPATDHNKDQPEFAHNNNKGSKIDFVEFASSFPCPGQSGRGESITEYIS